MNRFLTLLMCLVQAFTRGRLISISCSLNAANSRSTFARGATPQSHALGAESQQQSQSSEGQQLHPDVDESPVSNYVQVSSAVSRSLPLPPNPRNFAAPMDMLLLHMPDSQDYLWQISLCHLAMNGFITAL